MEEDKDPNHHQTATRCRCPYCDVGDSALWGRGDIVRVKYDSVDDSFCGRDIGVNGMPPSRIFSIKPLRGRILQPAGPFFHPQLPMLRVTGEIELDIENLVENPASPFERILWLILKRTRLNPTHTFFGIHLVRLSLVDTMDLHEQPHLWMSTLQSMTSLRSFEMIGCDAGPFLPLMPRCLTQIQRLAIRMGELGHADSEFAQYPLLRWVGELIQVSMAMQSFVLQEHSYSPWYLDNFLHYVASSKSLIALHLPTCSDTNAPPMENETIQRISVDPQRFGDLRSRRPQIPKAWYDWRDRNIKWAEEKEVRCKAALVLILGMRRLRRAQSGLLASQDRALIRTMLAPLIWNSRYAPGWREQGRPVKK